MQRRVFLSLALMAPAARASRSELETAVRDYAGGTTPRAGRVKIEIAPLVENGNAVPVGLKVDSPMSEADHVTGLALFNELNPQRDVVRFKLSQAMGRAEVATRIRLATSQRLVAVARMSDGSCWMETVDVVVTLAACVE
ncbi:SoxY-related AACIE arm protein [Burkholderiaceae bacterium UC74_6]